MFMPHSFVMFPPAAGGSVNADLITSFNTSGGGTSRGTTSRLGFSFTVGGDDLLGNTLAAIPAVGYGSGRVRIHKNSDNSLVATADITFTTIDTWHTASVTEFTLLSGQDYTISIRPLSSIFLDDGHSYTASSLVTINDFVKSTDSSDDRPTTTEASSHAYLDALYI